MSERRTPFSRATSVPVPDPAWIGKERRNLREPVSRGELDTRIKGIHERLDGQDSMLSSIHGALFDKDDTGEHKHIGLIVMFEEINNHMKVVCNFARWFKWAVVSLGTIAGGYLAISKAMGWS